MTRNGFKFEIFGHATPLPDRKAETEIALDASRSEVE